MKRVCLTDKEILSLIKSGSRDFSKIRSPKAVFRSKSLSSCNFFGADLHKADFRDADLVDTSFRGSNLRFCQARDANFFRSNLSAADLAKSSLINSCLSECNLSLANFSHADLEGADLSHSDLSSAIVLNANLRVADLRGCSFANVEAWSEDVDLSLLPSVLQSHTASGLFNQSLWGAECGTPCCLAGKAAEFVGCPSSSGHGVIAIALAMPEFDLNVLYETDPVAAINELSRFVKS